jgi:hypothetical protein
LSARFRVLSKPLFLNPQKAQKNLTATIYLHGFLRSSTSSRQSYTPPGKFHSEDKDNVELIPGTWRKEINAETVLLSSPRKARNSFTEAKNVRQELDL